MPKLETQTVLFIDASSDHGLQKTEEETIEALPEEMKVMPCHMSDDQTVC